MCLQVLNLAARYSDPELATSVIRILSERRSVLSLFHYEALIEAYTGAHDLQTAFRVLSIMTKAGTVPDASTTRPLFEYLTSSPTENLPGKAWETVQQLFNDGHSISVAAINVIIESYVQSGFLNEAMDVYKQLHKLCASGPNIDTFNNLLQGISRRSMKAEAMFLASEMTALGIKPDRLSYDRLIMGCLKEDDYEDAFRYLEEMIAVGDYKEEDGQKGWWMRAGTATAMVQKCVVAGDERAWNIIEGMEARGMGIAKLIAFAKENWPTSGEGEQRAHAQK